MQLWRGERTERDGRQKGINSTALEHGRRNLWWPKWFCSNNYLTITPSEGRAGNKDRETKTKKEKQKEEGIILQCYAIKQKTKIETKRMNNFAILRYKKRKKRKKRRNNSAMLRYKKKTNQKRNSPESDNMRPSASLPIFSLISRSRSCRSAFSFGANSFLASSRSLPMVLLMTCSAPPQPFRHMTRPEPPEISYPL